MCVRRMVPSKVLPEKAVFVETAGAKLNFKGVKELEDIMKKVKEAGGGVVFVDEAYQLKDDRQGKQALDFILPLAEGLASEHGPLVRPSIRAFVIVW